MSSKKKKQAPNAFYYFMLEFQHSQKSMGRFYSMAECSSLCGDMWQKLPPEEKLVYQHQADEAKHRMKSEKFNSKGEALQKIHQIHYEKELKLREMNETIVSTLQMLDRDTTLLTKVFHVIHVNYFCKTDNGIFIPAEIALAEFTLRDGIIRVAHSFMNSGAIPNGYWSTALEHCNDTHRTPIDLKHGDKTLPSKGLDEILSIIMDMIQPGGGIGELPPLYTMPDEVNINLNESCVLSLMNSLETRGNLQENTFRVFNLSKLFFELRNIARPHTFPSLALALSEMEKDVFKYTNGIACDFHEEEDVSPYCSKSIVQRWVYVICDHVCKDLGVTMRPGFHCPKNADLEGHSRRMVAASSDKARKAEMKEDRNSNYVSHRELPIREPHVSRASSYWDSDACSIKSTSSVNSSVLTNDEPDMPRQGAEEPPKRGWGNAAGAGGWNKVASSTGDAAVPKFDNLDDFPSIGGASGPSRPNHNHNQWTRGRGRGRTLAADFSNNLRLE